MEQKLIKIFKKAQYTPAAELGQNVWLHLMTRDKNIARIKLWIFSLVGFASLAGLIPAFKTLASNFAQSGFSEYFSLLFGNGSAIFSYWKELIFSLAESLPVMSMIYSLSLVFIFLLSLKYFMKQISQLILTM